MRIGPPPGAIGDKYAIGGFQQTPIHGDLSGMCPHLRAHSRSMHSQLELSEGVFVYVLGLVVIATQSGHFWFGLGLAVVPVATAVVGRAVAAGRAKP